MSHPNIVCGPVPSACGPRDLPSLLAELNRTLAHAEDHLRPALAELNPGESAARETECDRPPQTVFGGLVDAVDRAHRVANLAEQVAARVGYCPPKGEPEEFATQLPNHRCFTVRADNPMPQFHGR